MQSIAICVLTNLISCYPYFILWSTVSYRGMVQLEEENRKCRIHECDKEGIPEKLGYCSSHYEEYEEIKQEMIQDDYYYL